MLPLALSRKTLFAPIALLLIIAAMTGFLVFNHFTTARQTQGWVIHSHEVIEAAQSVFADVQDVESGARGFMIRGNPAILDDYRAGLARLPRNARRLESLVADNPRQQARAQRLSALLRTRADVAVLRVNLGLSGRLDEARAVQSGAGRAAMDEARVVLGQLVDTEKAALAERSREAEIAEWVGIVIALCVSGLSILGLGVMVVALFRANRHMEDQIAAREASEAARREADLLYRAVFDNAGESLFVVEAGADGRHTLLDVNRAFERVLDRSIDDIRGRDIREIAPGELGETLVAHYNAVLASGEPAIVRTEATTSRGLRVWESTLVPVRDEGGRPNRIVGASRDITERERTEAQVRTTQKMEAIGHLTGGVAHDFNNLLQVIRGNLELLEPHVQGADQAEQRLRNALHGAERASQLTRQLLAFARRQPLEPRVVNLGRLVDNMTDLLRRTLGESVAIEPVIAGGLWNTLADPAQVESAVLNLAINARDAMPDGGQLRIALDNAALDGPTPAGLELEAGDYVAMTISDTGHGMDQATLARVFEPFFTTKGVDKGTGLGLSMVYGFVKQSQGHIHIESAPGRGTTVAIYLPRSSKTVEEARAPARPREAPPGEVILVVEDEEMVRTAAVSMLRGMGYTCVHAHDGAAALAMIESGVKVDLLFTDVVMPGPIGSRDLAERAQAIHPGLPVLFTSGYSQDVIVHHGRLDEGVQLLSKPYQKEDLARRVRGLLDAARPVVLIVEDEPLVRLSAVDMIEELGFVVLEAEDAPEALGYLKSGERIDILFCDVGLPGMRGPELAKKAAALRPGLRVVFASGYGDATEGVDGGLFLSKPYDREDLERTLRG
jgi:PAS domain S-box-containing protein